MILNNSTKLEQKHLLSQTQIQSLEMLSMCNAELKEFLENEYNENPLLELQDSAGGRESGGIYLSSAQESQTERLWEQLPHNDGKTAEQHLFEQIEPGKITKNNKEIYRFLIQNIDENGFYSLSLEETARMIHKSRKEIQECLYYLQGLEPVGIFQKNLQESLVFQLEFYGVEDEILNGIIRENLEELGSGQLSVITRKFGITTEKARKYKALISALNPKPLAGYTESEKTEYIVPDVIVTEHNGMLEAELNDQWIGEYGLSDYYLRMIKENTDPQLKEYFQKKLERARMVIKGIQQRRMTILSITEAVIRRQKSFLLDRDVLRPMTMKEVSEELGISASTVSRAIGDKYLQYPGGVIFYRKLFTIKAAVGQDGQECSAHEIKDLLFKLIEAENRTKPLSDSELVNILKGKGISISRRGVAKYRSELGIPGSFARKE